MASPDQINQRKTVVYDDEHCWHEIEYWVRFIERKPIRPADDHRDHDREYARDRGDWV